MFPEFFVAASGLPDHASPLEEMLDALEVVAAEGVVSLVNEKSDNSMSVSRKLWETGRPCFDVKKSGLYPGGGMSRRCGDMWRIISERGLQYGDWETNPRIFVDHPPLTDWHTTGVRLEGGMLKAKSSN